MNMRKILTHYKLFIFILICLKANGLDFRVGALNFSPMMICKIGSKLTLNDIIQQKDQLQNTEQVADFSGYELDILIRTAQINESDFKNIFLTCYSSENDVLEALNNKQIDYAIGGIHIDYTLLEKNLYFSLPLYTGGLKVAVKVNYGKSIWSFFDPFHWSLWIVIFFTAIFVSILTWLFEDSFSSFTCFNQKNDNKVNNSLNDQVIAQNKFQMINNIFQSEEFQKEDSHSMMSTHKRLLKLQGYQNFLEMLWQTFSSLFFASSIRLQKFSARSIFLGFWFVVIIVSATYISNLTTLLSYKNQTSTLNNYNDIVKSQNVRIYTFENYINKYIKPSDFAGKFEDIFITFSQSKEGLQKLIQQFSDSVNHDDSDQYHVLLLDTPIVHNVHSRYPCSTAVLHETVNNFNYGVLVKDPSVLKLLNTLLYGFIDDPYWLNLIQTYLNETPNEHSCYLKKRSIDLYSISGLWILLGISIIIAIIINRVDNCLKNIANNKRQKELKDSQKSKFVNTYKQGRLQQRLEGEYQSNASPSLKGEEVLQSDNRRIESNQLQNLSGLNGKNHSMIHQNEVGIRNTGNSIYRNERAISNIRKDNNSLLTDQNKEFDDNNEIWSDFLLVSDYIHIPSKDIHLQAQEEIQKQIQEIEKKIKSRFNMVEESMIRILKQRPMKANGKTYTDFDKLDDKSDPKKMKNSYLY